MSLRNAFSVAFCAAAMLVALPATADNYIVVTNYTDRDADVTVDGAATCHAPGTRNSACRFSSDCAGAAHQPNEVACVPAQMAVGVHTVTLRASGQTFTVTTQLTFVPAASDEVFGDIPAYYFGQCHLEANPNLSATCP